MTLQDIEKLTYEYAIIYHATAEFAKTYQAQLKAIHDERKPILRRYCAHLSKVQVELEAAIKSSPELFVKPRTQVFSDFKVGLQKQKGTLDWDNDKTVVAAIRKHFEDQAKLLIKTKETPIKKALDKLSVQDLRKIGVTVNADSDRPIIIPVKDDVSKLIDALLAVELSKDDPDSDEE